MKESNMPRADFVTSLILIVFGIGVIWASAAMPRFEDQGGNIYDSPGIVPGILGVLVTGLSVFLLIRSFAKKGHKLGLNGKSVGSAIREEGTLRMLVTMAVCVLYGLVLLRFLHFIASTLIFCFAFVMIFEYDAKRRLSEQWKVPLFAGLLAVLTTAGVFGAFRYLFLVNMP